MALEWRTVYTPLAAGVDAKSDQQSIAAPRLRTLRNGWVDRVGGVYKRKGYQALSREIQGVGTITSGRQVDSHNEQLLQIGSGGTDDFLWTWSPTTSTWTAVGYMPRLQYRARRLPTVEYSAAVDYARAGGIEGWVSQETAVPFSIAAPSTTIRVYVRDIDTGSRVSASRTLMTGAVTTSFHGRIIAVNDRYLVVVWREATSLYGISIDTQAVETTLPQAPILIEASASDEYDAAPVPGVDRCVVASENNAGAQLTTRVYTVGAATITSVASATLAAAITDLAVNVTPTGRVGVALHTTVPEVRAVTYTGALGGSLTLGTNGVIDATAPTTDVACGFDSSETLHVWHERETTVGVTRGVYRGSITSGGVVSTSSVVWRWCNLASRGQLCTAGDQDGYAVVAVRARRRVNITDEQQRRLFLVKSDDTYFGGPTIDELDLGLGYSRLPHLHGDDDGLAFPRLAPITGLVSTAPSPRLHRWDTDPVTPEAQRGRQRTLGGALQQIYDGVTVTEHGFALYPEYMTYTPGAGGSMDVGTYQYRVRYYRLLPDGSEVFSADSGLTSVTLAAGQSSVAIVIGTLPFARGPGTYVARVYRSRVNVTAPLFLVATTGDIRSAVAGDTVSLSDITADSAFGIANPIDLIADEVASTQIGPPAVCASGRGRVFAAVDDESSRVWYSKAEASRRALEFSDRLVINVADDGGPITALAVHEERLYIFKRDRIWVVSGDGLNNAGGGADFSLPELVSEDVGAISQRAVAVTADGLAFLSTKGWHVITGGTSVTYYGALVERLATATSPGIVVHPATQRVYHLQSGGGALAYDTAVQQWAEDDAPLGDDGTEVGVSGCSWQDTTVRLAGNGTVYVEQSPTLPAGTGETDNGELLTTVIRTGWFQLPTVHRVGRWIIRGRSTVLPGGTPPLPLPPVAADEMQVIVRTYVDRQETPIQTATYTVSGGDLAVPGSLVGREWSIRSVLSRQIVRDVALEIEIRQTVQGQSVVTWSVSEIGWEIGELRGVQKNRNVRLATTTGGGS